MPWPVTLIGLPATLAALAVAITEISDHVLRFFGVK
jgi:hypothetical protein